MAVRDSLRNSVVLDGSNIVHGGARGEDVDGNRLIEAIDVYRNHGYIVYPRAEKSTTAAARSAATRPTSRTTS